MTELLTAIKDWPGLIQGVLASALFAAVMYLGQKTTAYAASHISALSQKRRVTHLRNELARYKALAAKNDSERAFYASLLWLRASRSVIKGLIWMALGLISSSVIGVFGIVGFLGFVYYLFSALEVVKAIHCDGDVNEKIVEIRKDLGIVETEGA